MRAPPAKPNRYAAHARFIEPARETPGLRPVLLGFALVELLFQAGQKALGLLLRAISPALEHGMATGNTPVGLLLNLGSFALLGLAIALILRVLHDRSWLSLLGLNPGFGATFRTTCLYVAVVFFAVEILLIGVDYGPEVTLRPLPTWLTLLLPALVVLLVQTGAEELFYRGYLQQRVAVLLPHPAMWLILPNLPFALAHWNGYAPPVENLAYMLWAFCFGLAASDLTARAGSLAPALGLHLMNNAYAFLFFGQKGGNDSGLALVVLDPPLRPVPASDTLWGTGLPAELLLLLATWLAARLAIAR
ncbi:CPBP family intramembrane metalloprotease [Rhodobacteraceae bacterium D3-12]|nr:CPBP family intramembrane metalloprotease [Rhodobacteraceae bacterium D3-12]